MPQTPEEKQEKGLLHLRENDNVVILAAANFPFDQFMTVKTAANAFIHKVDDATAVKHQSYQTFQSFYHAAQSKPLAGSLGVSRAKIDEKHRIFFISRFNTTLKKLVIFFVADDPNHKYKLNSIEDSYTSKGYPCGSDNHWTAIINAINNKNIIYLETPKPVYLKPTTEQKPAVTATMSKKPKEKNQLNQPENLPAPEESSSALTPLMENVQTETESKETPTATVEPATTEKESSQLTPQMKDAEPEVEDKEEAPAKNKKKKKKKKKQPSEESIKTIYKTICEQTDTLYEFTHYLEEIITRKNSLQIVTHLLNLGMDPDLINDHGFCLMRAAMQEQQVEIVKLLLKRG